MAYKTEIQVGVKGAKDLEQALKTITKLSRQIDNTNKQEIFGTRQVASVNEYARALAKAERNLNKTRIQLDDAGNATKTYKKAIDQYVSALGASNQAQKITNDLIQQEINNRGGATAALKAYNAEAAKARQTGSMAGSYLRGGGVERTGVLTGGSSQYPSPIGPQPDTTAAFMQRTQAAAQAASRLTAEYLKSQRAARGLAEEQRRINTADFIARTDAAAQAASRQTAEFIRQERITKQIQKNLRSGTQYASPIGPQPAKGKTGLEQFAEFGLGAGFPLLFGGGAGQVLGGALGTALGGGGPASFGLQIAFSAIGGQIEDALARIKEIDTATQNLDMDALADSAIFVNAELRDTVQNLVDVGENQRAVEAATNAVVLQTGVLPGSIGQAADAVTRISNAWDETVSIVSGLVSILTTDLVNVLAVSLELINGVVKGVNVIASKLREISGNDFVKVIARSLPIIGPLIKVKDTLDETLKLTNAVDETTEGRLATLKQTGVELEKELGREKEIFAIESRRAAGNKAEAKLNNAQVSRDLDLAKLRQATEDKILAKRREFAGVTSRVGEIERDYQIVLINQSAEIERQRILKKFSLDEEAAGRLRAKELAKQQAEETKQALDAQKQALQTNLAILQNTLSIEKERNNLALSKISLDQTLSSIKLKDFQFIKAAREAGLSELDQLKLMGLERLNSLNVQERLALINQSNVALAREEEKILREQFKSKLKAAEIEYESQLLSIDASVSKAKIEEQLTQIQTQQLQIQLTSAKIEAQGIKDANERAAAFAEINRQQALINEQSAEIEKLAKDTLDTAIKQADIQRQIAKNKYEELKATIQSEELERRRSKTLSEIEAKSASIAQNTRAAAEASNQISSTSGGSSSSTSSFNLGGVSSTTTYTAQTSQPIDPDVYQDVISRGPYKTPGLLVEALDDAQEIKNLQTAKMAKLSTPQPGAYASPGSYMSKYSPTQVSDTGSVNVTTGPVMQIDDKLYVTMEDLENALTQVASSQAKSTRSYGARRYGGIS